MQNKIAIKKRNEVFDRLFKAEKAENIERIIWLSFRDIEKPKGERFLGVIVTRCFGFTHAIIKTHARGINPGGDILPSEIVEGTVAARHFDILMSKKFLLSFDYI